MEKTKGRAKGGEARAKKLTPEERSAIAKRAASMRWEIDDLPRAICSSENTPLVIADRSLDAYVLEDGTRVLSQAGFLRALGRHKRATYQKSDVPPMLRGAGMEQFLTPELIQQSQPIIFCTPQGLRAYGYRAELLPKVCEIYLKARDAGALSPNQKKYALQADVLIRGLATVGIIALVDEATGYQEFRAKNALAQILEKFIAKELQPWVKTFPDDYYKQIFRLRGLIYPNDTIRRPQYFGILTNNIVYERLAPGVLDELKKVTVRDDNNRPKHRYFQRLTSNIGYPKLREHLGSIVSIMKLSNQWDDFMYKIDTIHPRYNSQLPLLLQYNADEDDGNGI
jgi:hypothetical protein